MVARNVNRKHVAFGRGERVPIEKIFSVNAGPALALQDIVHRDWAVGMCRKVSQLTRAS